MYERVEVSVLKADLRGANQRIDDLRKATLSADGLRGEIDATRRGLRTEITATRDELRSRIEEVLKEARATSDSQFRHIAWLYKAWVVAVHIAVTGLLLLALAQGFKLP